MTMRPRFWSAAWPAVLTTLALASVAVAYWYNEKSENVNQQQQVIGQATEDVVVGMAHQFAHIEALINNVRGFHYGSKRIAPAELQRYVYGLRQLEALPAVQEVVMLEMGSLEDIPEKNALLRSAESASMVLSAAADNSTPGERSYVVAAPLYARDVPLQSLSQRRAALEGWVRVRLREQDLMAFLMQDLPADIGITVHDANNALLFRNTPETTTSATGALPIQTRLVQLAGTPFTVRLHPLPALQQRLHSNESLWVLLTGFAASALVGLLAWLLGHSRSQALEQASHASQSLQESNRALQGILNAMPDLMFSLDAEGRYLEYWSPRQELLALPAEQFLGKRLEEVLPTDAAATCHRVIQECTLAGHSTGHQIQLTLQGQTKWFELSASRADSVQGTPRFVVLSRDITARKQVEQDLREHEQQLTLALKGGDMGFWDWDVASGGMRTNERWFTMLGLDPHTTAMSLELWHSRVHPADLHKLEDLLQNVILNPQGTEFNVEIRALHADGSTIWIQDKGAVFTRDADGKPLRVVGTHIDITARKLDEERLRLSEYAFKSITQGIIITNLEGNILVANDAFCSISGYARDEILGRNCRFLQGPQTDPATLERIRQSLRTLSHFSGEIFNYRKDGTPFWNDLAIAPVFNADNEPSHFVGITKDITDKKQADLIMQDDREAIRNSQAQLRVLSHRVLEAQETERRRVAHELHDELGQSLTAIKINLLSQAHSGKVPSDIDLENVRIVEDTLQQVRRLALALRPSMLDDLGLAPALAWLAKAASVNRDVVVECHHRMDRARLPHAVETACFRIVQESLTNARRHAHASRVDITLEVQGSELRLTVSDNGVGFDTPKTAATLAGNSLGLLGMRERAAAIGGTIHIRSTPGQGSTIELLCTLSEPETTLP